MLTVDKVCLDLASSTRSRILAAFTAACLQTHLASRQQKRVVIKIRGILENEAHCWRQASMRLWAMRVSRCLLPM